MNKREAYQLLYSLASANNEAFRIRISDKGGRCRTYGGKAGHTKPRADFLKELTQFQNSINNVGNTPKIDIVIPDFVTRPEPVTKPKSVISSKYNKTCKCRITKYDSPCTYYLSWHNGYWTTKSSQLEQYREMIDGLFDEVVLFPVISPVITPEITPSIVATSSLLPLAIIALLLYSRTGRK